MTDKQRRAYPERQALLERERCRIEDLLIEYATPKGATEIGEQLITWAMELDDVAEEIWNDDCVRDKFSYDGVVFTHKDKKQSGFFFSRDGLCFLQIFDDTNIRLFFEKNKQIGGKTGFFEWTKKNFVDIPKIRLQNLREGGYISLFNPHEIEELQRLAFYEQQMQE